MTTTSGAERPARPRCNTASMLAMTRPDWETDGLDWPHREASRFVEAAGLRWHVQTLGSGPVLLLLHGTGAATHSWRGLLPILAERFTVVAPDLPGHGFTQTPPSFRLSLPGMARQVGELMERLDLRPRLLVGHSAGAAIAIRASLDGRLKSQGIVGVNAALRPFRGAAGDVFPVLAKLLFLNPLAPRVFAWAGQDRGRVERLMVETGSTVDPAGLDQYARLFRRPGHVAGALGMMANWNLKPLERALSRLQPRLLLVAAEKDRAVPPEDAPAIAARAPAGTALPLPGLGHLAHEEAPAVVADILFRFAEEIGVLAPAGGAEGGDGGAGTARAERS